MLYLLCLKSLNLADISTETIDLKILEKELYTRLDPSIRYHLQKRGITIKENTYIGFDTEYQTGEKIQNTLVSSQIAVTTKTFVQIPKATRYVISQLDEETNKVIPLNQSSSVFNYSKIENSITMCIDSIRELKFRKHDMYCLMLTEGLKLIKGFNFYEHTDYCVFSLSPTSVQPYIHYGEEFSLKALIQISSDLSNPYHEQTNKVLISLFKDISQSNFENLRGELFEKCVLDKYLNFKGVLELKGEFENPLPLISNEQKSELFFDSKEKSIKRKFMKDLFPQKISVCFNRNYYLISHLTPADFCMLSDFNEIKEDLNILNGSFVTLGKPLKFYNRKIHIRDTMLLAPGGDKSLKGLGSLYGDKYEKIQISKIDIEDMQGFLTRDRVLFTEYALRDALISLRHAC